MMSVWTHSYKIILENKNYTYFIAIIAIGVRIKDKLFRIPRSIASNWLNLDCHVFQTSSIHGMFLDILLQYMILVFFQFVSR